MSHASLNQIITTLSISILPLLLGIICHEVAHGWVAWRLGDPTAHALGRLTLNPARHLEPIGVAAFFISAVLLPFTIGWARPVPVNMRYFKRPARDMALVALAGPCANMLLGLAFAFAFFGFLVVAGRLIADPGRVTEFWARTFQQGVFINFMLAWFNLLPVPPLDGSKLLMAVLPPGAALRFMALHRYGLLIMLALVATGLLSRLIALPTTLCARAALELAGSVFGFF